MFPVSAQVVAFTIAASLMIAPCRRNSNRPVGGPAESANRLWPKPMLGRVGPCPGCPTAPNPGLYNFVTRKGPRPIEPVPGILLSIPLGNAVR